jgi:antitoxin MazE
MQVSKWGNSLAVRLPAAVVEALALHAGDQVEITIAGKRAFHIEKDQARARAIETIRGLAKPLPKGFKFDREDVNER